MKVIVKSIRKDEVVTNLFYGELKTLSISKYSDEVYLTCNDFTAILKKDVNIDIRDRYHLVYYPCVEEQDEYISSNANLFTPYDNLYDLMRDCVSKKYDNEWVTIEVDELNNKVVIEHDTDDSIIYDKAHQFVNMLVKGAHNDTDYDLTNFDEVVVKYKEKINHELNKLRINKK